MSKYRYNRGKLSILKRDAIGSRQKRKIQAPVRDLKRRIQMRGRQCLGEKIRIGRNKYYEIIGKIQKRQERTKKGFTLVELIVVIVILGILAAILVPSFIGYMNKANNSQAQIQARSLYLAGKTIAAEEKYDLPKTEIKNTDEDTGNKAKLTELAPDTDQIQSYTVTI